MAKNAIAKGALAEAMLIGSDEVAEGALEAFRETGLRVPKDVAVIIYQDIQTLESKWPTGTCLEMFPDYVWENALELLFGRIDPEKLVIASEESAARNRRIENLLSPFERQVLRLYLSSYSYEEMSRQLGSSTKAVDNALQRVRRKLRNVFTLD